MLVGALAARVDASLRLTSKSKGPRRSLVAIGIDSPQAIARVLASRWTALRIRWPEARLRDFAW